MSDLHFIFQNYPYPYIQYGQGGCWASGLTKRFPFHFLSSQTRCTCFNSIHIIVIYLFFVWAKSFIFKIKNGWIIQDGVNFLIFSLPLFSLSSVGRGREELLTLFYDCCFRWVTVSHICDISWLISKEGGFYVVVVGCEWYFILKSSFSSV